MEHRAVATSGGSAASTTAAPIPRESTFQAFCALVRPVAPLVASRLLAIGLGACLVLLVVNFVTLAVLFAYTSQGSSSPLQAWRDASSPSTDAASSSTSLACPSHGGLLFAALLFHLLVLFGSFSHAIAKWVGSDLASVALDTRGWESEDEEESEIWLAEREQGGDEAASDDTTPEDKKDVRRSSRLRFLLMAAAAAILLFSLAWLQRLASEWQSTTKCEPLPIAWWLQAAAIGNTLALALPWATLLYVLKRKLFG